MQIITLRGDILGTQIDLWFMFLEVKEEEEWQPVYAAFSGIIASRIKQPPGEMACARSKHWRPLVVVEWQCAGMDRVFFLNLGKNVKVANSQQVTGWDEYEEPQDRAPAPSTRPRQEEARGLQQPGAWAYVLPGASGKAPLQHKTTLLLWKSEGRANKAKRNIKL